MVSTTLSAYKQRVLIAALLVVDQKLDGARQARGEVGTPSVVEDQEFALRAPGRVCA